MMETAGGTPGRTGLQLRVGTFVLVALAALGALVYFLGRQAGIFERQYRLRASFHQIGGLIEGATVRLAGVPVGRVTAIRLPEAGDAPVQVELTLVRRVHQRIRTDSVARIETLGLLGDRIVEITLGSPGAPALPEGAELATEEPLDTGRLTRQGTELLRNLVAISADLRSILVAFGERGMGQDLADAARALRSLLAEVREGEGLLHRLIYDRQLGTVARDAIETLRQVRTVASRLDRLLADARIEGWATQVEGVLADARDTVERLGRVVRAVEEGRGLLHELVYGEARILEELEQLLGRAGAVVAAVEEGQGALGVLLRDPETARALRRLVAAAERLAGALDRGQEADGLLAALLVEPGGRELLDDLRQAARGFRELTERLSRGEGWLGALAQPGSEAAARQMLEGLGRLGRLAEALGGDERWLAETLTDLRAAMRSLRVITERIEAGEGTLGGLLHDPTVYENLAAFLEGAQRSLLLRALIRAALGGEGR